MKVDYRSLMDLALTSGKAAPDHSLDKLNDLTDHVIAIQKKTPNLGHDVNLPLYVYSAMEGYNILGQSVMVFDGVVYLFLSSIDRDEIDYLTRNGEYKIRDIDTSNRAGFLKSMQYLDNEKLMLRYTLSTKELKLCSHHELTSYPHAVYSLPYKPSKQFLALQYERPEKLNTLRLGQLSDPKVYSIYADLKVRYPVVGPYQDPDDREQYKINMMVKDTLRKVIDLYSE